MGTPNMWLKTKPRICTAQPSLMWHLTLVLYFILLWNNQKFYHKRFQWLIHPSVIYIETFIDSAPAHAREHIASNGDFASNGDKALLDTIKDAK